MTKQEEWNEQLGEMIAIMKVTVNLIKDDENHEVSVAELNTMLVCMTTALMLIHTALNERLELQKN